MYRSPYGLSSVGAQGGGVDPLRMRRGQPQRPEPAPRPQPGGPGGAPGAAPAPGAPAPMPAGPGAAGAATPTFAQLQAAGVARPAPPPAAPAGGFNPEDPRNSPWAQGGAPSIGASPTEGMGAGWQPFGGAPVNDTAEGGTINQPLADGPPGPPYDPGGAPQVPYAPGGGPTNAPPTGTPGTPTSAGGGGTNPTVGPGGQYPLQGDIEAKIRELLGHPSQYDDQAFQGDIAREYNKIDDQYALGQKDLTDNLARRGLGSVDDSTVGLGRLSDLNVGRKSAKETVLSDLSSARAKSYTDDIARVLGLATQYGQGAAGLTLEQQQQQFNTQVAIAQLLAAMGYRTPQTK